MSARRKLTPEKKAALTNFISMYDLKTTGNIQDALKDLLGDTIQAMLDTILLSNIIQQSNQNPSLTSLKHYCFLILQVQFQVHPQQQEYCQKQRCGNISL